MQVYISKDISSKVLTIGSEYKNHRGGIGGVINTYSKYFVEFNFIATYPTYSNKLIICFYFIVQWVRIICKLLVNSRIRIVHIHGSAYGSFYRKYIVFMTAKYVFRRKIVYHSHGSEFELFYKNSNKIQKFLISCFLENVDVVICLSKKWKSFFTKSFSMQKIIVLENIVEKADDKTVMSFRSGSPLNVLFLGAIGHRKGIFDLLEVLRVNKSFLNEKIVLTIAGNGEIDKLQKYIQTNQLESLVKFEGWVAGDKKRSLLLQADLYILPSYNEGLPLSILEAMSYGLPVISTPVGGTSEVVSDGVNGFLINPGDINSMFERLKYFVENTSKIDTMGAQSLHIVQPYYPQNVIPKLQRIYEYLVL